MGRSADANIYDINAAAKAMQAFLDEYAEYRRPEATVPPAEFLRKVAPGFGYYSEDQRIMILVYNEFYEDYNPTANFSESANMYYFGTNDLYSLMNTFGYLFPWLDELEEIPGSADVLDADTAKELGLDYPDHDIIKDEE